jgi:hypothetical protein
MLKGQFSSKIAAEFTPPQTWVLAKPLSFSTWLLGEKEIALLERVGANVSSHNDHGKITCDEGMKTDLASVPRVIWAVLSPWDVARAAVIHDHLYATLRQFESADKREWRAARKLSDHVFLWGMQSADPKIPSYKIWSAYWAVRIFGRWAARG